MDFAGNPRGGVRNIQPLSEYRVPRCNILCPPTFCLSFGARRAPQPSSLTWQAAGLGMRMMTGLRLLWSATEWSCRQAEKGLVEAAEIYMTTFWPEL